MKCANGLVVMAAAALWIVGAVDGQDWPQWRGAARDGKAPNFKAPATWPKELTQKWKVVVGQADATPSLVGDKLYVFTRQVGDEIIRCLDVSSGKEIWQAKYAAEPATGSAGGHPGPRSTPTVADGKVVTLGVRGVLSCFDAADGKPLWKKDDFAGSYPRFFTSSSPLVVDGLCIAQLGGDRGGIIAYDLAKGNKKWEWTGDGAAYSSPILMTTAGAKSIVAPGAAKLVGLKVSDGAELWEIMYSQGRYNAATPIIDGQTLIVAGPGSGMTAMTIEKQGNELRTKDAWRNTDNSVIYNTPVLKNGLLFGLSTVSNLFCIDAKTGKTNWTAPLSGQAAAAPPPAAPPPGGGKGKGGRGGGRDTVGYGSVVDAGAVLLALSPQSRLVVFEPSDKELKQLASYKVAESPTYAYPVVSGNRIFIKDQDAVTLWTIE